MCFTFLPDNRIEKSRPPPGTSTKTKTSTRDKWTCTPQECFYSETLILNESNLNMNAVLFVSP